MMPSAPEASTPASGRARMAIGSAILPVREARGSLVLISPPVAVLEIAPAKVLPKVLQGAVPPRELTSSLTPET